LTRGEKLGVCISEAAFVQWKIAFVQLANEWGNPNSKERMSACVLSLMPGERLAKRACQSQSLEKARG
jgi:hypothetical protein